MIAQRLFNLFVSRTDTYAVMLPPKPREEKAGYTRLEEALTVEVVDRHLRGEVTVGPYQLDTESRTKTLAFDIDPEHVEDPGAVARAIYQEAAKRLHPDGVVLEASRWPDPSYHIWVVFDPPIPAAVARWMGGRILEAVGNPKGVELFPKQDRIDPGGFGNFVKLPLGLHRAAGKWSRLLDPATMQPLPNEAILEVRPLTIPEKEIQRALSELERARATASKPGTVGISCRRVAKNLRPCFLRLMGREGLTHDERVALVNELEHQGYSLEEVKGLFHEHRSWNPNYDLDETEGQVESVYGHYGWFTRGELEGRGVCFEDCPRRGWVDCRAVPLSHINLAEEPDLAGRPVVIEAVVASTSIAYTIPKAFQAAIPKEDGDEEILHFSIKLDDPLSLKFVGVNEDVKYRRLLRIAGTQKARIREREWRTIYLLKVRPPVLTLERLGEKIIDERGFEYKAYDLYVVSDHQLTFEPSTLIRFIAKPLGSPKSQKTVLLAYQVEFPEEVRAYNVEKLLELKAKLDSLPSVEEKVNWILGEFEKFSGIVKRRNLALAGFLAFFSPIWISLDGDIQRGWCIIVFIGDTTTGKSETARKLIMLLDAGMMVTAETASQVGLTGTAVQIEKEGWWVDWGFLVLADRKLLALDGAHKLPISCHASLAEAERTGVVTIAKAAKNSAYARTRLIKIFNPVDKEADKFTTKPLNEFLYPCQSLATILDKTGIARVDIAAFSDSRDVEPEEVNKRLEERPDEHLLLFREAVRWAWSDIQFEFTDEAIEEILTSATELYKTFHTEEVPLVTIDMKWKLARASAALAALTLSTDDLKTVKVTGEHIKFIVEFLHEEYSRAGLNTLAQTTKYEVLELEDVASLLLGLTQDLKGAVSFETICGVLRGLVLKGRKTRDELMKEFGLAETNQLRPLIGALTSRELIKSGRGYYPKPKLIQAFTASNGFEGLTLERATQLVRAGGEG
ncbi:MAG: hypothetical protein QXH67_00045 [Candidatus Bathyarchaeia archaeon]